MGSNIKLTYFTTRGLGESIRILLKYGDIDFEDIRVDRDKWPALKESAPFGQLPLYEENGKVVAQSMAIARYVAKKVNLVGDDDWENLEIDSVVDTIKDLILKVTVCFIEQDPDRKQILRDGLVDETFPFYFERLDKIAEKNNGYLAAGKLTWADIYFNSFLGFFNYVVGNDILSKYSNLVTVNNNVLEVPSIKSWVENRPVTNY